MDYLIYIATTALWIGCIIHADLTQRYFPWLMIIFFLPGLGSLIYLGVEVVPIPGRRPRDAATWRTGVRYALPIPIADFARRGARSRWWARSMPSVHSRKQHMARRQYADAVAIYEGALTGQFSEDPALLQGLARARLLSGDGAGAQTALDTLRRPSHPL